jgi:hypothetical protein
MASPGGPDRRPLRPGPDGQLLHRRVRVGMFVGAPRALEPGRHPRRAAPHQRDQPDPRRLRRRAQTSLFGRAPAAGTPSTSRSPARVLDRVIAAAGMMFGLAAPSTASARRPPHPGNFNLQQQEYQRQLNERARELGVRRGRRHRIRALFDGAFAGRVQARRPERSTSMSSPRAGGSTFKEKLASVPSRRPRGPSSRSTRSSSHAGASRPRTSSGSRNSPRSRSSHHAARPGPRRGTRCRTSRGSRRSSPRGSGPDRPHDAHQPRGHRREARRGAGAALRRRPHHRRTLQPSPAPPSPSPRSSSPPAGCRPSSPARAPSSPAGSTPTASSARSCSRSPSASP